MSNEKNVEKTKIYTDQKHRFGATITMPHVGDVQFDHEGKAEVDSQHVHKLIADVDTVFLADKTSSNKKAKEEPIVEEIGQENEETSLDSNPELNADAEEALSIDSINKLNLQELQDLATAAGLPEKDWSELKKQKLIKYLKDNLEKGA